MNVCNIRGASDIWVRQTLSKQRNFNHTFIHNFIPNHHYNYPALNFRFKPLYSLSENKTRFFKVQTSGPWSKKRYSRNVRELGFLGKILGSNIVIYRVLTRCTSRPCLYKKVGNITAPGGFARNVLFYCHLYAH